MKATMKGELRGVRAWEFENRKGHTVGFEQDGELANISIPDEFRLGDLPPKGSEVEIEVDVRGPFEGRNNVRYRLIACKTLAGAAPQK